MIKYINDLLNDWARWRLSDRATIRHALGSKSCWPAMLADQDPDVKYERHGTLVPLNDLDCCQTDKAVCALPSDLKAVIVEFYTRTGTADMAAKRCGVSKATLFRKVDAAHQHIMGTLNDLTAGVRARPVRPLNSRASLPDPAVERTLPEKSACIP